MPPDALVVVRSPCWCNYPLLFRRHKQDTVHRRWHQHFFVFVFILTVHPLQPTHLFAPDLEAKPLRRNSSNPVAKCRPFLLFFVFFFFRRISNAVKFKKDRAGWGLGRRGTCGRRTELQNKTQKATPQFSLIPISSSAHFQHVFMPLALIISYPS